MNGTIKATEIAQKHNYKHLVIYIICFHATIYFCRIMQDIKVFTIVRIVFYDKPNKHLSRNPLPCLKSTIYGKYKDGPPKTEQYQK